MDRSGVPPGDDGANFRTCVGCEHLRVHDWHYFYCRDLGKKEIPEDWKWWFSGAVVRIWTHPTPHKSCKKYG
jgi:hypothetical protein